VKASDIRPRDVIDGWTVTGVETAGRPFLDVSKHFVLLTLEREATVVTWEDPHFALGWSQPRRSWYRADEEVEVSRG
jgi:hypothetical protein